MLNPKGNLVTQEKGCWKVLHKNIDKALILGCHEYMYFFLQYLLLFFSNYKICMNSLFSTFFSNIWERAYILKNRIERTGLALLALAGLSCWHCAVPQKVVSTQHFITPAKQAWLKEAFHFLKQTQPRQYVLKLHEIESNFIIDLLRDYQHWSLYQDSFNELRSIPQPLFIQHWDVGGIKMSETSLDSCP